MSVLVGDIIRLSYYSKSFSITIVCVLTNMAYIGL